MRRPIQYGIEPRRKQFIRIPITTPRTGSGKHWRIHHRQFDCHHHIPQHPPERARHRSEPPNNRSGTHQSVLGYHRHSPQRPLEHVSHRMRQQSNRLDMHPSVPGYRHHSPQPLLGHEHRRRRLLSNCLGKHPSEPGFHRHSPQHPLGRVRRRSERSYSRLGKHRFGLGCRRHTPRSPQRRPRHRSVEPSNRYGSRRCRRCSHHHSLHSRYRPRLSPHAQDHRRSAQDRTGVGAGVERVDVGVITGFVVRLTFRQIRAYKPVTAPRRLAGVGAGVGVDFITIIARLALIDSSVATGFLLTGL